MSTLVKGMGVRVLPVFCNPRKGSFFFSISSFNFDHFSFPCERQARSGYSRLNVVEYSHHRGVYISIPLQSSPRNPVLFSPLLEGCPLIAFKDAFPPFCVYLTARWTDSISFFLVTTLARAYHKICAHGSPPVSPFFFCALERRLGWSSPLGLIDPLLL